MKYLLDILDKETEVYTNYLDLATQKKTALIENDIDALELITDQEKGLSTKVLALEAARVEFLREQGFPASIQLSELVPQLEKEDRKELTNKAAVLKEVLTQCKKVTESNMALMKQSSNYINHMIKIFTSSLNGSKPATYSEKGTNKFEAGKIADIQG
ncbi:MAG: flagellar protein FlgN [Candidatus Melainabacteria bacterium]|jgi:flagellar biosynthesis/type III secretory pathway chaperone|nr:flagellar protein FlgN [Candidatus Melainabacteria bacterium]